MEKLPRLSRAQVIAGLREHAELYGFVTTKSLAMGDPVLRRSIVLHFAGLDAARVAAGVPGAPYRKPAKKTGPKVGTRPSYVRPRAWTRKRVIDELRRLDSAGRSTRLADLIAAGNVTLVRSAQVELGGLRRARRIAGIAEPKRKAAKRWTWTRQRVIDEITSRARKRQSLASSRVPFVLYSASRRYFGSWPKALASLGLEHTSLTTTKKYTKEVIVERLRGAAKAGSDLLAASLARVLDLKAVNREYGTLKNALHAAGLDAHLAKRKHGGTKWDRARVIETLRARAARGEHLATAALRRAMQLYFSGGAYEARQVAGVPQPRDLTFEQRRKALAEFAARHRRPTRKRAAK